MPRPIGPAWTSAAAILAALQAGPRTILELSEIIGSPRSVALETIQRLRTVLAPLGLTITEDTPAGSRAILYTLEKR